MAELLVVRSKLKSVVNKYGGKDVSNVSGDFGEALSDATEALIKKAVERAKANGRRTVQGRDV